MWSFTKFTKNAENSVDSADLISFIKRLIINVISSVINDSFSILSFLRDDLN
jgi:hypothetical protein